MTRRCVPVATGHGVAFAHTAGPLTDADRAAINAFDSLLHDLHQEEHSMTQPDQTPPADQPAGVDLVAAGVAGWVLVLEQIAATRAQLDEAEIAAREKIQAALGDAVDGVIDGRPVVRWLHTAAPKRFDKKTFTKDHPELVEKYTTFGPAGRRFELIKPKATGQ